MGRIIDWLGGMVASWEPDDMWCGHCGKRLVTCVERTGGHWDVCPVWLAMVGGRDG